MYVKFSDATETAILPVTAQANLPPPVLTAEQISATTVAAVQAIIW